jgi:hypothetical protein
MTYIRQCIDEGIKFARIMYEKCSQLKKKSHNHLITRYNRGAPTGGALGAKAPPKLNKLNTV